MARNIEAYNVGDFTGGLNLNPDEFKLAPNELTEALNVDVSYRGGVRHRSGYSEWAQVWHTYDDSQVLDAHAWYGHPNGPCIVGTVVGDAGTSTVLEYRENSYQAWIDLHPGETILYWTQRRSAAEFDSRLFLAGEHEALELDAAAGRTRWNAAMVTGDFNDDLDNPTNDKFPAASCIAFWQGSMWAADIYENTDGSAHNHPSRVRWSHPNHAKDWHGDHYIDLGDDNGGAITALVPDGDRLLIFRERKIHAIVGAPPQAVQTFLVSDTLGAAGPEKVAATEQGVYFWNEERGVYKIGRSSIEWIFERLFPAMVSGRMDGTDAVVTWGGDRLYVKVKYDTVDGGNTYRSWFVYDPSISKHGCWVQHAFTATPQEITDSGIGGSTILDMPVSVWFTPPGEKPRFLVALANLWVERAADSATEDDLIWNSLGGLSTNQAKFRTSWIDIGQPGQIKRFRRADVVGNGLDENQQLAFEVYADYDNVRRRRFSQVRLAYPREGAQFGTAVFGTDTFGAADIPINVVERTAPLGRARAIQMSFEDQADPASLDWNVDLIVVKYTPYRLRG